jgi:hypothetical protein
MMEMQLATEKKGSVVKGTPFGAEVLCCFAMISFG